MANSLSPELMAALVAKGIIPAPSQDASIYTGAPPSAPNAPDASIFTGAAPAAPPPPPTVTPSGPTVSQIWSNPSLSYQQKMAASRTAAPDPAPPPAAPLSPAQQLQDDIKHGRISYQQAMAVKDPGAYVNPNAGLPPKVIGGRNPSSQTGVAAPQGQPEAPQGSVEGVFAQPAGGGAAASPFRFNGGGAGGMPGIVAAHSVSTVSPETRAGYEKADADKLVAADQGSEAEQAGAENSAAAAQNIANTLQAQRETMQKAEDARRKKLDMQQADYDKIRQEADAGVIRPADVGMMGHIAIALGAAGASLAHTQNFALDSINKRIDDSLAAQKANLANKREGAKASLEGLGQMRERFGDERVADAAERARQLEQAKATGDVMVAQAQSPMLAAKWAGIKANIEAEQAQQHSVLEKWMPAGLANGAGSKLQALAQKLYEKKYGQPGNTVEAAQQEAAKLLGMGQGGEAPLISGAPKGAGGAMSPRLARRMADLEDADKAAARLQAKLTGGTSLSLSDREQAKADANILRNAGYKNVPEDPLTVWSSSGARSAGVAEVRKSIATEKGSLQHYGGGSAGGDGETENGDEFIRPAGSE